MRVDLLAGTAYIPCPMPAPVPTILIFDSGLGGLTVFAEVLKARPDARYVYAADDAGFPYGRLSEEALVARVLAVMDRLIGAHAPDLVVIACNTASTLVLPHLRARFAVPFVGTVPAIKPAAQVSLTKRITVLATPGTVARDYTRDLIETYAAGCSRQPRRLAPPCRLCRGRACRRAGRGCGHRPRDRALLRRGGRRAHRCRRARLHALSAAPRAPVAPRALAGHLDRPGAGDRTARRAAHRRRRSRATRPTIRRPWRS